MHAHKGNLEKMLDKRRRPTLYLLNNKWHVGWRVGGRGSGSAYMKDNTREKRELSIGGEATCTGTKD